ncbi:MAG: non-ribosomal peptide synthetase, partial [Cyanobacteria bacterium CRU_2_1]|nr:non-ribosomal peptide synthetase [Cyanobacteria bacterium CRU_2_1]
PILPSPTLYKTGDRARYRPNGTIEFLGRLDQQVKLRGFRIELGEIEAILLQHPEVKAAAVVLHSSNHPQLVAYVVLKSSLWEGNEKVTSVLSDFLQTCLPDYMIPSRFLLLDALPLLPNGKLNRRALPVPDALPRSIVPPRNPTEASIAAIWTDVLKLETVSIYDSLFELGGHSLLATRINSRLRQTFQLDLPLRLMFEKPTIAALAERITTMQLARQQPSVPLTAGHKEIEL